ncbi:B-cell lymphoma 3 protein [Pelobates fuscus]|uniref:B-cell lymphoma 3 protein n=1 Tax=Pelobates fuscus TaxID=191477 RepID=UPI002FE4D144
MDAHYNSCTGNMETSYPLDLSIRKSMDRFGANPRSPHKMWSARDIKGSQPFKMNNLEGVTQSTEGQNGSVEDPGHCKDQTCLPLRKRRYPPPSKDERPLTTHMEDYPSWPKKLCGSSKIQVPQPCYYSGDAPSFLQSLYSFPSHVMLNTPLLPMLLSPDLQIQADIEAATQSDDDGDTALHIAVVHGNIQAAQWVIYLLHQGHKNMDPVNNLRQTPLHLAVITDQPDLVSLLLSNGCSPKIPDRNGQTCVHLACENESINSLRVLLKGGTWDPEATNYQGMTALHIAIRTGRTDATQCLLDNGMDVDAVEIKSGRTPLIQAVENGCEELVCLLLQRGAQVNAQTYAGNTALHVASGRGLEEITRMLLRSGADSGIKNCHNDTSITVAKNRRITDILHGKSSSPRNQYDRLTDEHSDSSLTPSPQPPQVKTPSYKSVSPPPGRQATPLLSLPQEDTLRHIKVPDLSPAINGSSQRQLGRVQCEEKTFQF